MRADNKSVSNTLKTAKGQIEGILKMIEDDRYCIDISNQILAVEALLKKANNEVLKGHIEGCIKEAFESDNTEKIDEVLQIIYKMNK